MHHESDDRVEDVNEYHAGFAEEDKHGQHDDDQIVFRDTMKSGC